MSAEQIERELHASQQWLLENGFLAGSRRFLPQVGEFDDQIMELIKK